MTLRTTGSRPSPSGALHRAPSWAERAEIDRFAALVEGFAAGEIDPETFRTGRLRMGVYGIRGRADVFMVRAKIPGGALTVEALDALADVAQRWSRGWGHLTTRQNVQFHFVALPHLIPVLRRLATAGLTSSEACGDTVRNVTGCPLAGVCRQEVLDTDAAVEAIARHFLRNPVAGGLPRKFKVAVSGCPADCALAGINDIGVLAVPGADRPGFRLLVGGGLGTAPRAALALEPFTAAEQLLLTAEAVLRVFDRETPHRHKRAHVRMKFLVARLGVERFRQLVFAEREALRAAHPELVRDPPAVLPARRRPPATRADPRSQQASADPAGFDRWRARNMAAGRQPDQHAAYVAAPLGDLTASQFRLLVELARDLGITWRITARQALVARDVATADLARLYDELAAAGLGGGPSPSAPDVVSCPGTETCNLALTASRGAAQAIADLLDRRGLAGEPVTVNVSGCPNSCGQQQLADIGLSGQVRRVGGDAAPGYRILLGGRVGEAGVRFGAYVARVPARRAPDAVAAIVARYAAERVGGEAFADWLDRVGAGEVGRGLAGLDRLPPRAEDPELFTDWGETEPFEVLLGRGECAS